MTEKCSQGLVLASLLLQNQATALLSSWAACEVLQDHPPKGLLSGWLYSSTQVMAAVHSRGTICCRRAEGSIVCDPWLRRNGSDFSSLYWFFFIQSIHKEFSPLIKYHQNLNICNRDSKNVVCIFMQYINTAVWQVVMVAEGESLRFCE